VEGLKAEEGNPEARIQFTARDSYSPLARAEYSVDGKDWVQLFPVDRLTDAPQENYVILLRDLATGEHTVAVRVFDQFENSTSAKVTFATGARKK
jgi:hypothetical protein